MGDSGDGGRRGWGPAGARYIKSQAMMLFWGGFMELPKGLAVTLQTEAVAAR